MKEPLIITTLGRYNLDLMSSNLFKIYEAIPPFYPINLRRTILEKTFTSYKFK